MGTRAYHHVTGISSNLTVVIVLGCGPAVHGGALGAVHVCVSKNSLGVPLYQVRRFVVAVPVNTGGVEVGGVDVMKTVKRTGAGVISPFPVVALAAVVDLGISETLKV